MGTDLKEMGLFEQIVRNFLEMKVVRMMRADWDMVSVGWDMVSVLE